MGARIADAVRRERARTGLSAAEVARRAGVSKATLSQLESGSSNPGVETLWAVATALGVSFATLVDAPATGPTLIRARQEDGIRAAEAPYEALLLSAAAPGVRRDLYLIRAEPGSPRLSDPHPSGTTEHLVLLTGRARVGPTDAPYDLEPGDYLRYPGDAPHVFEALESATSAVLISEMR
ncbi:helix-turn-helix domain-containing protein [Microbacterium aurantiacum]|uniref:helix-turn-helix domain-containing protein n=1 Tax=Microbacterium aurantiacum TaxID=162393 RepID=UPI003D764219